MGTRRPSNLRICRCCCFRRMEQRRPRGRSPMVLPSLAHCRCIGAPRNQLGTSAGSSCTSRRKGRPGSRGTQRGRDRGEGRGGKGGGSILAATFRGGLRCRPRPLDAPGSEECCRCLRADPGHRGPPGSAAAASEPPGLLGRQQGCFPARSEAKQCHQLSMPGKAHAARIHVSTATQWGRMHSPSTPEFPRSSWGTGQVVGNDPGISPRDQRAPRDWNPIPGVEGGCAEVRMSPRIESNDV